MEINFWNIDASTLFKNLQSQPTGLDEATLLVKQQESIPKNKRRSDFEKTVRLFIKQFSSPLVLLLMVAIVLSAIMGETTDVYIILFILLSTGLLSFWQEYNAGKIVEKLQSLLQIKSKVIRGGHECIVAASEVVSGDVIKITAGDIIPADCLVFETNELHINESALTGESFPVRKEIGVVDADTPLAKRTNSLWKGCNVVSGTGKALVVDIGSDTVFGKISESTDRATITSFEKGITHFGIFILKITVILAVFVLIVNIAFHRPLMEAVLFSLALAVGMAPELLPAINTIAMSAGAKRMLQQKVIVKKMSSIQNLGEVNLLCTDKTGTITNGEISVSGIYDIFNHSSDFVRHLARLNAHYETGYSNPIDEALKKLPVNTIGTSLIGEVPYDFTRKRLSIGVQMPTERLLISKGALTNILEICTTVYIKDGQLKPNPVIQIVTDDAIEEVKGQTRPIEQYQDIIQKQFELFSSQGFRVVGVCYKKIDNDAIDTTLEKDMVFAGFILFNDPVKSGIALSLQKLRNMHVNVKIITGDNKNIAQYIGSQIGIINPIIMTGSDLEALPSSELNKKVKHVHIFAEVAPNQKEHIIEALQTSYTVAYMGDGINDVAALNRADVGISVDNAVDVAKEAADFVLMEKDLGVLAEGILQGRITFANTLKYIFINTGATFGNMFSVAVASFLLPFLPMLPKQILLTNFISDFPYLAIAGDEVDTDDLKHPGKWDFKLIRNFMIVFGLHSSFFDIVTFLTLYYGFKADETIFQTGWFTESVMTELLILFIIRTRKSMFKSRPGKYLFWFSLLAVIFTLIVILTPLSNELGLAIPNKEILWAIAGILVLYVITADMIKIVFFKRNK